MANFKKLVIEPLRKTNPVTVLVLGICSCLAVTAQLKPALVMGASVTIVTALCCARVFLRASASSCNLSWSPHWSS